MNPYSLLPKSFCSELIDAPTEFTRILKKKFIKEQIQVRKNNEDWHCLQEVIANIDGLEWKAEIHAERQSEIAAEIEELKAMLEVV